MKTLLKLCLLLALSGSVFGQTTAFLPPPRIQFVDANGSPLAGGKLYSYNAGTNIAAPTYHIDTLGNLSPNTNPVILDSTGSSEVRILAQLYKFVLMDANGVQIWQVDNVSDAGLISLNASLLLNPVGGALQTVVGPIAASWFQGNTPHTTSPGVRVSLLDQSTMLDTPTNPPTVFAVNPAAAGQTYAVPDPASFNSNFVLNPGPQPWIPSHAYSLSAFILPYLNNPCDFTFLATTAGTSAVTNPVWSTTPCVSSASTVLDGTAIWASQGAYPNTNTLDCSKIGINCIRTAYVYFEGGGCNNTTASMGWDTFGSNSPTPMCITGSNIQKGALGLPAAVTLIQEASHVAAAAATNVIPYGFATSTGSLLEVECFVDGSRTVSGATDGTNAYTRAKASANGVGNLEIWYFNGNSTSMPALTNLTVTFSGAGNSACNWHEYSGVLTASALDQTASANGTIAGVSTGTTAGTAQNTELILAAVGSLTAPSFTGQVGWSRHALTAQSTNVVVTSEGLIQQATAPQQGTFTMVGTGTWASAIVTFKANVAGPIQAQRQVVLPRFFLPSLPINASVKWQATVLPVGNAVIPSVVLGGAVVCAVDGATDDQTFNTQVVATTPVPASAANTMTTTGLDVLPSTGCGPNSLLHFQLQRRRYDANDNYEGFVNVSGVSLNFGVSQ